MGRKQKINKQKISSQPRDWTQASCIGRRILYHLSHQGSSQLNQSTGIQGVLFFLVGFSGFLVHAIFMLYLYPWYGQFFENKFNNSGEKNFFSMLQNQLCSVKITRFYFLFLCFCESLQVGRALASQYMISTSSQNISDDWVCFERKPYPLSSSGREQKWQCKKVFS